MFVSRNCYEALLSLKWSTTVTDIQQRRYFFWQHLHVNKEIQPNFLFIEKNKKIVQKCIIDLFWKASKNFEGGERQPERTEILWKGRWKIIDQNYWSLFNFQMSNKLTELVFFPREHRDSSWCVCLCKNVWKKTRMEIWKEIKEKKD